MNDLLQSWWQSLLSGLPLGLSLLLMVALLSGGVITIFYFSIARHVVMYKHRDWKFADAANYIARQGLVGLFVFAIAVATVWLVPLVLPLPFAQDQILMVQWIATAFCFVAVNVHWHGFVLRHIGRPPET